MKKIKTNKNRLFDQFEFSSSEMTFYLDTKTEEVVFVSEFGDLDDDSEIQELIEFDPERFVAFPEQDSRGGYNDMVDFADSIENRELQEKFKIMLNGREAFRRFKDVLLDYPKDREAWFTFEEKRRRQRFEKWIEDERIEIIDSSVRGD